MFTRGTSSQILADRSGSNFLNAWRTPTSWPDWRRGEDQPDESSTFSYARGLWACFRQSGIQTKTWNYQLCLFYFLHRLGSHLAPVTPTENLYLTKLEHKLFLHFMRLTKIAKTTFLTFPQCWLIAFDIISLDACGIWSTLADDNMNDGSESIAADKLKDKERSSHLRQNKHSNP